MTLSDLIRQAVREDGRTLRDIAAAAGMGAPNLSRFLAGRATIRLDTAEALLAALGRKLAFCDGKKFGKILLDSDS